MKTLSKKAWISIIVVCALIVAGLITFAIVYHTALRVDLKAKAAQQGESQTIDVTWDTSKPVDKVTVSVYHGNNLVNEVTMTKFEDVNAGQKAIEAYYGKMSVKVEVKKGIYTTSEKMNVNLSASEYNIAPITATMPVTQFSLSLPEVTDNGRIPTFVWFKRSGAWDWNSLPQNVHPIPVAAGSNEFLNSAEEKMYKRTSAWVKELYEINKDSKFHFYYNDYFAYGWVQATYGNGIPAENYDVVLLSDGTASFEFFNQHFDNANADAEYAKMAKEWKTLKKQVAKAGKYNKRSRFEIGADELREYAYVMATEESNVQWWLTRISGTLANNNPEFYNKVETNANVKVKNLGTLLANFTEDEGQYMTTTSLKALYKFSDDMFEKAAKEDKKVMVILGSWTDTENESYFEQYTKATIAYYGDEYVYYYKGHPRNPTNSVPGKLERLKSWGLIDIDSTIPAEMIFFFNPEAFCSGLASTTFVSLTDEQSCAIYNYKKDEFTESYKDKINVFMSKANASELGGGLVPNDNCFLLEIEGDERYDIAIYNANKNSLKYYKYNTTTTSYELVTL